MDPVDVLMQVRPVRRVRVAPDSRPALVVASDAQVEPGSWPGGGVLVHDPLGPKVARHLQFRQGCLTLWDLTLEDIANGKQPIALCECAMLPFVLLREGEALGDRDIIWMAGNTAALGGAVKGSSGEQTP